MKVFITGHQGLGNRGCEALLRSTIELIRRRHPLAIFLVPSQNPQADARQWPQAAESGVQWIPAPRVSTALSLWERSCGLIPDLAHARWPVPALSPEEDAALSRSDVLLSIGGDNYTMDYGLGSLALYVGMATRARQRGLPTVLWGASVGPFDRWPAVRERMREHLAGLTAITVRESCSTQALADLELGATLEAGGQRLPLLRRVSDPAFTLMPQSVDLEPHWPQGQGPVLGLNLSPLAARPRPGETPSAARQRLLHAAATFVKAAAGEDGARVLLVPHVSARDGQGQRVHPIGPAHDDAVLLDELQARVGRHARIGRLPAWNAVELKQAIAHCDVFIGARTHAVVAALSSGVPAVALAYSPKARGIHRDLMDDEAGVLDVRHLDAASLRRAWHGLLDRARAERVHLRGRLPHWRARAREAVNVLEGLQ